MLLNYEYVKRKKEGVPGLDKSDSPTSWTSDM